MEPVDSDHDRWMDKIKNALRTFRQVSQEKAEQMQGHRALSGREDLEAASGRGA